jgi:diguanylate cyclase (GGDEF)-like protein
MEKEAFDLVISDMVVSEVGGIEVLQAAFRIDPHYAVSMITGYHSVETAVKLVSMGAADYITKPFNVDLIKVTVAKILTMSHAAASALDNSSTDTFRSWDTEKGAYNLQMFSGLSDNEVARSQYRPHEMSLLVMDIDKFESYGAEGSTAAGDQLTKTHCKVIGERRRPGDVLGRSGPSVFVLRLPEAGREEAEALGHQIRKGVEWHFTVRAGIMNFSRDASEPEEIFTTAKSAMEAAKQRGGDAILMPK